MDSGGRAAGRPYEEFFDLGASDFPVPFLWAEVNGRFVPCYYFPPTLGAFVSVDCFFNLLPMREPRAHFRYRVLACFADGRELVLSVSPVLAPTSGLFFGRDFASFFSL